MKKIILLITCLMMINCSQSFEDWSKECLEANKEYNANHNPFSWVGAGFSLYSDDYCYDKKEYLEEMEYRDKNWTLTDYLADLFY